MIQELWSKGSCSQEPQYDPKVLVHKNCGNEVPAYNNYARGSSLQ